MATALTSTIGPRVSARSRQDTAVIFSGRYDDTLRLGRCSLACGSSPMVDGLPVHGPVDITAAPLIAYKPSSIRTGRLTGARALVLLIVQGSLFGLKPVFSQPHPR